MEISKSGKEIESHAEEDRLSMTTIQKMQDLPTAFIINFDGDHPTTEDSGRLGPFMPPKKLLQRERLRQATKQENTMKRDTSNLTVTRFHFLVAHPKEVEESYLQRQE